MARPCLDAATSRLNFGRAIAVESSIRSGEGCGAGEMSRAVASVHDDLLQ